MNSSRVALAVAAVVVLSSSCRREKAPAPAPPPTPEAEAGAVPTPQAQAASDDTLAESLRRLEEAKRAGSAPAAAAPPAPAPAAVDPRNPGGHSKEVDVSKADLQTDALHGWLQTTDFDAAAQKLTARFGKEPYAKAQNDVLVWAKLITRDGKCCTVNLVRHQGTPDGPLYAGSACFDSVAPCKSGEQ